MLASCLCMNAQTESKDGYIVTLGNDTIHGTIDYRTNAQSTIQCVFKADDKEEFTTYSPGEIKEYCLIKENRVYVSRSFDSRGMKFIEFL